MNTNMEDTVVFNRKTLQHFLKTSICQVVFLKKDGSERVMNCTLLESHIPEPDENAKPRKYSQEILPVWDIDKGEWRSFRLDSVLEINLL